MMKSEPAACHRIDIYMYFLAVYAELKHGKDAYWLQASFKMD